MIKPSGSMGPFLEGYRGQEQKVEAGRVTHIPQATDVMDVFAMKKAEHITMFEISSKLMIPPQEARRLVDELAGKRLVSSEVSSEGNDLVVLTKRGKIYIQEE